MASLVTQKVGRRKSSGAMDKLGSAEKDGELEAVYVIEKRRQPDFDGLRRKTERSRGCVQKSIKQVSPETDVKR
jgi:hypothetical protein